MSVDVRKITGKEDFKHFFDLPWKIYKDDPNWVAPLLSMRQELLDINKNPSWKYLKGDYYIASRNGEVIGSIAAYVNPRHNEVHDENVAFFGSFECINDAEVANALLTTALTWAKDHGYDTLRGPQTFTVMEEVGILVENFSRPVLLMPYNPPYYQNLIESAGFTKAMDLYSFHVSWEAVDEQKSDLRQRFARLTEKLARRGKITVRPFDAKNRHAEFDLFKAIYNDAWEHNWGFVPYTSEELDALVEGLGMIFDPKLACFGYINDQPAGFLLAVPDFSQVLAKAQAKPGIPEPITLIKALWHWKLRSVINWVRVPLMGVKEEFRGQGVDLVMYDHMLRQLKDTPYQHLDAGWVLETNKPMLDIAKSLAMEHYKTHRIYEKTVPKQVPG